ncbi:MAG: class I tRNA ligase family protein, partial [Patescibacteria group bacterium]
YLVARKAGWDTHGLPIEIEAEKRLGIKSKRDIEKIGVGAFNRKARESIWEYKDEWEKFSRRIGFWLDFQNPYITYEPKYIETLWWVISQIDKRKLLYKGYKVLPWCPRCGTALASHEVAQGYEDVTETSVYVKFKVKSLRLKVKNLESNTYNLKPNTYLLAWTTTPWTLPGNVALAVGKSIDYALVRFGEENYILAKDTLEHIFQSENIRDAKYEILNTLRGKDLIGLEYEPLFDLTRIYADSAQKYADKIYRIYSADFVTTEEGTGIVHTAVMYGEDDYELGTKVGLPKHHTVDEQGKFIKEVKEFEGQFVKDAEKGIVEYLKNRGLLFKTEQYAHAYPFCWRCK